MWKNSSRKNVSLSKIGDLKITTYSIELNLSYLQQRRGRVLVDISPWSLSLVSSDSANITNSAPIWCNLTVCLDTFGRSEQNTFGIELENEAAPQIGWTASQKSLCDTQPEKKKETQWKCIINILQSCHPTNVTAPARIKKGLLFKVGWNDAQSRTVGPATVRHSIAVYLYLSRKAQRVSYCTNWCSLLSDCGLVMVGVSHICIKTAQHSSFTSKSH